jgi:peptidoglycan-associated lipoprotein
MKLIQNICLAFLTGSIIVLSSCGAQKPSVIAAEKAYNAEKYFIAADLYKKAIPTIRNKKTKAELIYKVAESYRQINNSKQSSIWYEKAVAAGYEGNEVYLKLANAYKFQDRLKDAIATYKEYLTQKPGDSLALLGIENCNLALKWKEKATWFDVFNEGALNTKDVEYAPSFYGKGIIFTSNRGKVKGKNYYERTGKNYENIFASATTGKNRWTRVDPLNKAINSDFNEGVTSFDNNNRILYYTQCNGNKGKEIGCTILQTQNEGNTWTEPKPVEIPNPDSVLMAHPSINADGTRIYFTSVLKGGYGGKDIWYSERQGTSWGNPVNAGPKINTVGDEEFPFIHPSGSIYFASNGHKGIGGFDVFFCDFEEGDWTDATNLKSPINSTGDDFGFILDETKETGYISSNRFGGKGEDDIYSVIAIPLVFNVSGKAINNASGKSFAGVKINIIGSDGSTQMVITDPAGKYKFALKKDVNYQLSASKYRFFGDVAETSTYGYKESKDLELNFRLNPIPLKEIIIKGILYDLASADLKPESIERLDTITKTLSDNPTFVIEIASHTDSRADSTYNNQLSLRRAQSVVNYLVSKGIESERLRPRGYGESKLLNECKDGVTCPEEMHALNRRTTFSIISEDYVPKEAVKLPDAGKKVAPKAATPRAIAPNVTSPAKPAAVAPATTAPATTAPATPVAPVVAPAVTPAKAPATAVPVRKKP